MMLRILSKFFVAGVVLEKGYAVRAAPIVRYLVGQSLAEIEQYCRGRGWTVERHGS